MPYKDYRLLSFEVTTVTSVDSQEPCLLLMMTTCWLLNEVGANMQLTLKRHVLEVLNSTEDGTNYVWQLDAPLHHFTAVISSCAYTYN